MSSAGFLELLLSLSVQVAALIGVCAWLVRQTEANHAGHRLWSTCHVMILAIALVAVLLPHLRFVPHSLLTDRLPLQAASNFEQWLGSSVFVVWAAGAVLYASAILIGMVDVRRILATAQPLSRAIDSETDEVTILVSSKVTSPFCWQLQRPVIVLPDVARRFPEDVLSAIIRHELTHLRSGHPVSLFLQRLVEMLFWFHPAVWWASRQTELHREFHCDCLCNRNVRETTSYLKSLLCLSEVIPERPFGLPARLNFQGNPSLIRRRVERLMNRDLFHRPSHRSDRLGVTGLVASALLMTCLWLPVDVNASSRCAWSPWPPWSARALYEVGIAARDYEIDGHRLRPHEMTEQRVAPTISWEQSSTESNDE